MMPKTARRYDLFLPTSYNDGNPIPRQHFDEVEQWLLDRFGGVTSQQREFPLHGIWQGKTQLYLDQVVVMTGLDFRREGSTGFIARLKRKVLRQFKQVEILITETRLRVH